MTLRLVEKLVASAQVGALAVCSVCVLQSGAAEAQVVTENLTADLSGFIDISGATPSPVSAIDATFTITFNAGSYIGPTTTGLTVDSYSGTTLSSPLEYAWNPKLDVLSVGSSSTIGEIFAGQNDVVFQFNLSDLSKPRLSVCSDPGFQCQSANGNSLFYSSGYTLTGYPSDGWLATVANGVSVAKAPEIDASSAAAGLTLFLGALAALKGRRPSTRRLAA